jgi:endoglucanase
MDKNVKSIRKHIFSLVLLFFVGVISCSCSAWNFAIDLGGEKDGEGSNSNAISDTVSNTADRSPSLPDRSAKEEEKLGSFSADGLAGYGASNNYKNKDPMFNCTWTKHNVTFADGVMSLSLSGSGGAYYGAEYHSDGRDNNWGYNYTTGFYSVSMKPAKKSGVISSFFVYNGSPWNEIDIEFLGKDTTKVQFNYYTEGQGGHEYLYDLGFDAAEEFHEYSFDWSATSIVWYVDGKAVHRATDNIPAKGVYTRIMMNVWNGTGDSFNQWAGEFSDEDLPVVAKYGWIAYRAEV